MSAPPPVIRLFRMGLRQEADVVLCRNRAKLVAGKFGFDHQDQIRIATAVSEIARNAFRYAKGATAEYLLETAAGKPGQRQAQRLVCVIQDEGPGIPHLDEVLSGKYKSGTGMGLGITGARRLLDTVDVKTGSSGTVVRLGRELPKGKSVSMSQVQPIVDSVAGPGPANTAEELAFRDHEILFMMEQLGEKSGELNRMSTELNETNRGVVALYDELDTVHRLGHVLASKLELEDLLQAMIDTTTEISGAEIGVFVYDDGEQGTLSRQHTAGELSASLQRGEARAIHRLMDTFSPVPALLRIDDLEQEKGCAPPLSAELALRSYLAVPVTFTGGGRSGAMVFAHRSPCIFNERSERILSTVALQAATSIENAHLYKTVRSASAAKDAFLAMLSHELRTPLNPIFARLALLEERPGMHPEALEDIRLVRRNLELETRLIDDMLDLTRISQGKLLIASAPCSLHEIIEAARHACSGLAEAAHVAVNLELDASACVVLGDAVRLQQVFWNLIINAIKFSPSGGKVSVSSHSMDGGRIRVRVTDSGRGISPERLESIFQPFEQDQPAGLQSYGGLGLGLTICRNIVTAHNGEIQAWSGGRGQGAVFTVSLPLTKETVKPQPLPEPARPQGGDTFNILLVDDDHETVRAFKTLLERRGHRVAVAASLAGARQEAEKAPFQLLISDIALPDGSGYDLMRFFGKDGPVRGIAVSGHGMPEDLIRSLEAGFSVHLTKPLRIPHLEKAIAEVMSGKTNLIEPANENF
ncbi:MAG: sensor hybrid histidine kinase [Verrucomicrobiales bacterium]|nr:sensor hybrid histidine kinase [Verrucomicrobiales bacterium]